MLRPRNSQAQLVVALIGGKDRFLHVGVSSDRSEIITQCVSRRSRQLVIGTCQHNSLSSDEKSSTLIAVSEPTVMYLVLFPIFSNNQLQFPGFLWELATFHTFAMQVFYRLPFPVLSE